MPPHSALEAMESQSSSEQGSPRMDKNVQSKPIEDFMSYEEMLMQMANTSSSTTLPTKSAHSTSSLDSLGTVGTNESGLSSSSSEEEEPVVHSKIRFDLDDTRINFVTTRSELSPEEFEETWYTASEFSKISSWNRMLVKTMKQFGNLGEEPDHCIRGLEHRLSGQKDARTSQKTHSIYAVLQEQARQRRFKLTKDQEKIANLYAEKCFRSVQEALVRGEQDEIDARDQEHATQRPSLRKSFVTFDDNDLQDLKEIMEHEEEDKFDFASDEFKLTRAPKTNSRGLERRHSISAFSSRGRKDADDDGEESSIVSMSSTSPGKHSKKSRKSRISKLFKKKKGSSSQKSSRKSSKEKKKHAEVPEGWNKAAYERRLSM